MTDPRSTPRRVANVPALAARPAAVRPFGRVIALAAACALALALSTCENSVDPVGPSQVWTATYSLELTGSGTVIAIAYDDGTGNDVAATDATPSWTRTLLLRPGSSVAAHAQVGLAGGSVVLKLSAKDGSGHAVERTQSCEGTQKSCQLDIARETLP